VRVMLAGLVMAALPGARAADVDRFLKGVEDHYNNAKTIQVNFTQTYTSKGRKTTEKGTLYLRKPRRMRWQYSVPEGRLWISDGEFVYDYDPQEKRVERTKLKEDNDLRAPLAFLVGRLNFHEDFGRFESTPQGGGMKITALPKSDKMPYTEVTFLASPAFVIQELRVKDAAGSTMDYIFDNEKRDGLFPDSMFRFTPIPGVEVVDSAR